MDIVIKIKSCTPWRGGPDDRWIQYKIVIHINVLISHSIFYNYMSLTLANISHKLEKWEANELSHHSH